MSLLQKATIITTPTAHSNGVLHSIKGGSVADFDVVRGSAATRVNAEGLIEDISILSGELVTNGDFSNGSTGWTLSGTNLSIADGKATSTGSNFGAQFKQTILTTNKTYKLVFDIVDYTSGAITLIATYYGVEQAFNSLGTHTAYFTSLSQTELRLYSQNFIGSIDNISIKEVIDATNIPRIDYTDGTASLLLEPQSTNFLTYSEDFSNSIWNAYGGETTRTFDSSVVNPTGGLGAYVIEGVSSLRRFGVAQTVTPSTDYTFSFYVKNIDATLLKTNITNSSVSSYVFTSEVNTTGWTRVEINFTSSTETTCVFQVTRDLTIGGSVYFWGAQLEALPHATSYIPTSGAIATRLADVVTGAGDATTFNSTEGVLYAEIAALVNTQTTDTSITLTDGINNILLFRYRSTNQINLKVFVNGVAQTEKTYTLSDATDFNKIAIKWQLNNYKIYVNGVSVFTSGSALVFPNDSINNLSFTDGANNFFGKTKALAVWKEALSDQELECLTTI